MKVSWKKTNNSCKEVVLGASDRYFLEATEMSNERDKKSRTFATATEFITWASNPRIKDPKTIRLTKHNPDLLTLATLARVLDVLDG